MPPAQRLHAVLAAMHPCLVGSECLMLHQELEVERRRRIARGASTDLPSWESAVEPMVASRPVPRVIARPARASIRPMPPSTRLLFAANGTLGSASPYSTP
jgi:hypothetical protein